jgi:cell division septum initiation protein DivIVA
MDSAATAEPLEERTVIDSTLNGELADLRKRVQAEVETEAALSKQIRALEDKTRSAREAKLAEIEEIDEHCSSIQSVWAVTTELEAECKPLLNDVQAASDAAAQAEEDGKAVAQRLTEELKAAAARRAKAVETQQALEAQMQKAEREAEAAEAKASGEAQKLVAAAGAARLQARVGAAQLPLLQQEIRQQRASEAAVAREQAAVRAAGPARGHVRQLNEQARRGPPPKLNLLPTSQISQACLASAHRLLWSDRGGRRGAA